MKIFLASLGITDKLAPFFLNLLRENRHSRSVPKGLIIENASDYKGKAGQAELRQYYKILKQHSLDYDYLDLKKYINNIAKLEAKLESADFVYISGGNIFYLYYWVVKSGLDKILKKHVMNGLVFAGSSAGSVIAGPTLKYFDSVDKTEISPEPKNIKWEGLSLVNFVILPHWGEEKYAIRFSTLKKRLENDGFTVKTLTNRQAFSINGSDTKLVEEPE